MVGVYSDDITLMCFVGDRCAESWSPGASGSRVRASGGADFFSGTYFFPSVENLNATMQKISRANNFQRCAAFSICIALNA